MLTLEQQRKQIAIPIGNFVKGWGQYCHIKCANCGKMNGVWAWCEYVAADCDCTLFEGKGRFRTEARYLAEKGLLDTKTLG